MKPSKKYDHEKKLENDIHFTIDRNGVWYFHGESNPGPMRREALVKLFADKALKFQDGKYVLATPFESYDVEVEDVPFIVTGFEEKEDGSINLTTNIGDEIELSEQHKIYLRQPDFVDIDLPYIDIRENMPARLSQTVRDYFIDQALKQDSDLEEGDTLFLDVNGVKHPIAKWVE